MSSQPPATRERLAATKLRPPATPSGVLDRPRLQSLVDAGVRGPLTLVVGPAGSGKTVLVSSWAHGSGLAVAWLALDATDATPRRFWTGVARALQAAGVENLPEPEVGGPEPGDDFVAELTDALADRDEPIVLVLEDFHEIGRVVAPELDRLVERPPVGLRLVVTSRRDPPLRLGRLRLAEGLTEIRADALACTRDEADGLLRSAGVRLPDLAVTRLWERTEGWMAALTLAAISMRDSDAPADVVEQFDGEDLAISEYLMSEVLARQPSELQAFLMRTSIVDVLEGSLVETLTDEPAGHARLMSLAHDGVLITPIDRRGRWFRYHALFRELLRAELRWSEPEVVDGLHRRAAAWFAGHGDDARAVRHAVEGGAWDLAARLAADRWLELLLIGELDSLIPLVQAIPDERVAADPALAVALAAVSVETDGPQRASVRVRTAQASVKGAAQTDSATAAGLALVELLHARHTGDRDRALAAAIALLERGDVTSTDVRPELRSLVLTYLGTAESWTGQVAAARDHLRQALAAAEQARSPWLRLLALGYLAGAESTCGDVPAARRRAEQALELAQQHGWIRTSPAGAAAMVGALIATLQCRFDDAAQLVEVAERAAHRIQERPIRAAIALPKLVLLAADGRVEDALDVVRAALAELGDWPIDTTVSVALRAWEARLLAAAGDREGALRVLDAATGPQALLVLSTRARMLIDDGDGEAARALVAPALTLDGPMFRSIALDLWLVDALAQDQLLDRQGAARSLEHALDLAEPGRLVRPIVSHGNAILPLLHRHARSSTRHRALVDDAITLIEGRAPVVEVSASPLEPLSDREREVLGYMPTIMSNSEIATELYVSVNTVKTHMRSIYRKLGVDNRREAVARARQLKLLGSR
jgi:LuxR family maltose regulon positive regulatory protein